MIVEGIRSEQRLRDTGSAKGQLETVRMPAAVANRIDMIDIDGWSQLQKDGGRCMRMHAAQRVRLADIDKNVC